MKGQLPYLARVYIGITTALACLAVLDCLRYCPLTPLYLVPIVLLLGIFAGRQKVILTSGKSNTSTTQISLGFIADLTVLLTLGPTWAMLCTLAPLLVPYRVLKRSPLYQSIFNVSSVIVTLWIINVGLQKLAFLDPRSQVFTDTSLGNIPSAIYYTLCILLLGQLHLLINALLVTGAVALSMGWPRRRALEFFRNNTLRPAPIYLAAGCFIVMVVWIVKNLGAHLYSAAPLSLVLIPQPLLYFHNLRLHRERDQERESRFQELESLYSSMVQAMGRAIEAKDRYTQEHISRVVAMSMAIGRQLALSEEALRVLEVGAALHDIGKIAIPDTVLNKPDKLTDAEFEQVKEHAALGSDILQPVPFPPGVIEAVRHHHEKWDGTGYPDKLSGEQIPQMARIVAVADVYDALTSDRPYRAAWSHEKAITFMRSQVGTHFNAEIFAAFEQAMAAQPSLLATSAAPEIAPLRQAA